MKFKNLIYTVLASTVITNCSSSDSDDLTPKPDPDPTPTEKVTYSNDVKAIIDNNCVRCHGNPTANGAPFSLTTFDNAKSRIDRILNRINNASNPMPPNGLMAQGLRDNIQKWKDDGLLEN